MNRTMDRSVAYVTDALMGACDPAEDDGARARHRADIEAVEFRDDGEPGAFTLVARGGYRFVVTVERE